MAPTNATLGIVTRRAARQGIVGVRFSGDQNLEIHQKAAVLTREGPHECTIRSAEYKGHPTTEAEAGKDVGLEFDGLSRLLDFGDVVILIASGEEVAAATGKLVAANRVEDSKETRERVLRAVVAMGHKRLFTAQQRGGVSAALIELLSHQDCSIQDEAARSLSAYIESSSSLESHVKKLAKAERNERVRLHMWRSLLRGKHSAIDTMLAFLAHQRQTYDKKLLRQWWSSYGQIMARSPEIAQSTAQALLLFVASLGFVDHNGANIPLFFEEATETLRRLCRICTSFQETVDADSLRGVRRLYATLVDKDLERSLSDEEQGILDGLGRIIDTVESSHYEQAIMRLRRLLVAKKPAN